MSERYVTDHPEAQALLAQLLAEAEKCGQAGMWPEQDFEQHAGWQHGMTIDLIAEAYGIDQQRIFDRYCEAHKRGLRYHATLQN